MKKTKMMVSMVPAPRRKPFWSRKSRAALLRKLELPSSRAGSVRKRVGAAQAEPTFANEEFCAVEPTVADPELLVAFPSFHRCVDEFYTQLEENKAVELKAQHAQNVLARVDRIRADQGRRLQELEAEQQASERKASLIETNVGLVDRASSHVECHGGFASRLE